MAHCTIETIKYQKPKTATVLREPSKHVWGFWQTFHVFFHSYLIPFQAPQDESFTITYPLYFCKETGGIWGRLFIQGNSRKGFGRCRLSCVTLYTISIYHSAHKHLRRHLLNPFREFPCNTEWHLIKRDLCRM